MATAESNKQLVVLFACVQNAGRSQMAASLFNLLVDPAAGKGISAGSRPAAHVHPEVVEVMKELGVDLSAAQPQKLTPELAATANVLVTMGCGEACPFVPGLKVVDWSIPDPCNQPLQAVRDVRDLLHGKVLELAQELGLKLG